MKIVFFGLFFIPLAMFGHGDLHERIEQVTVLIKKHPDSAYLFLQRGELYAQHEEFKKALRDFDICRKKGYRDVRLELNEATVYFDLAQFNKTVSITRSILEADSENVKAYRLCGLALLKLNQFEAAGEVLNKVFEYTSKALPENFYEASIAWEQCKTDECQCQTTQVIYTGMETLSNLRGFYDRLIEIALNRNDFSTALYYQSIVINEANRKEWPLYNRGLIHLQNGNQSKAKEDFLTAKKAIGQLKKRQRNQKAISDLLNAINNHLNQLKSV